ncbi:uncharacterized protein LOC122671091 [Telopea speciosissima]|uniref:uncharacterized protein LOC122671091 n=1 Tax=Telopea speciosissima TaxID=54955 RepID=UPI001CC7DC65|nr:uncharacterized protein LOC122671091 [Telopea speciosissima]
MKNRASVFLKQLISVLSSVVKAKSLALKNKTSAMKSRLIILSFLKNKKILLSSITHKLHALVPHHHHQAAGSGTVDQHGSCSCDVVQNSNNNAAAIVLYHAAAATNELSHSNSSYHHPSCTELVKEGLGEGGDDHDYDDDDDKYPDLTHSLFESEAEGEDELDLGEPGGSVIDLVRNCRGDQGENFKLEDEIDQVADLFIRRFHRQMKMQKQESFKRYREMLERSV